MAYCLSLHSIHNTMPCHKPSLCISLTASLFQKYTVLIGNPASKGYTLKTNCSIECKIRVIWLATIATKTIFGAKWKLF